MTEYEWEPIPGWPGYFACREGLILSRHKEGRILKPRVWQSHPYYDVELYHEGRSRPKKIPVHRLVLTAFTGQHPSQDQVRHLDGDSFNNALANLAWGNGKDNAKDRERHGTTPRGESHGQHKLRASDVRRIRLLAGTTSNVELACMYGVHEATIGKIIRGAKWKHLIAACDEASAAYGR